MSIGNSKDPPIRPPTILLPAWNVTFDRKQLILKCISRRWISLKSDSFHALLASLFVWLFNTVPYLSRLFPFVVCDTHDQIASWYFKGKHFPIERFLLIRLCIWPLKLSSSIFLRLFDSFWVYFWKVVESELSIENEEWMNEWMKVVNSKKQWNSNQEIVTSTMLNLISVHQKSA